MSYLKLLIIKSGFEFKDWVKTNIFLGLELEHKTNGIIIYQTSYVEKLPKHFNIGKSHPLSTPIVVRSLDPEKDHFHPKEHDEEIFGPKVPYLNVIKGLV